MDTSDIQVLKANAKVELDKLELKALPQPIVSRVLVDAGILRLEKSNEVRAA